VGLWLILLQDYAPLHTIAAIEQQPSAREIHARRQSVLLGLQKSVAPLPILILRSRRRYGFA
jgi:hypothetical protein